MNKPKIKFEFVILAIVIIGLLTYLIFRNPDRIRYQLPELDSISKADIQKVEIKKSGDPIILNRADGKWTIQPQGYPADPDKLDKITSTVSHLTLTDVISETKSYSKYGLEEGNRITVRIFDENGFRFSFSIGKQAATYQHTYVKLENDKRVFHARESFRNQFDETVDSLRNKLVMTFDPSEISEIHMIKDAETLVFSKNLEKLDLTGKDSTDSGKQVQKDQEAGRNQEEVWLLPDGEKAKKEEIKSVLQDLSNLSCSAFLENKTRSDLSDPIFKIILKGNKEYTLEIFAKGKKEDDSYPAFGSESPYTFSLTSYQAERLMKKPDDIVEKSKQE